MLRFTSSAAVLVLLLSPAGCGEGLSDTGIVSQAFAARAHASRDYGWRTSISPMAVDANIADFY